MSLRSLNCILIWITIWQLSDRGVHMFNNEVVPHCLRTKAVCTFPEWVVDRENTMIYYNSSSNVYSPVVWRDNALRVRTQCKYDTNDILAEVPSTDLDNITTVDGTYRSFEVVNGVFPGPPIIVYAGQEVVVNVSSNLLQQGTTLHWHGLVQRGTNFMDGVNGITQCPIRTGQTFTYRFKVRLPGTYWWHSHTGMQLSDGLQGVVIGLPVEAQPFDSQLPKFTKDFIMMTSDFFPYDSSEMYHNLRKGLASFQNQYTDSTGDQCMRQKGQLPYGEGIGPFGFHSALINGKGRHFPKNGPSDVSDTGVPLETFLVQQGKYYKFRILNTGMAIMLKVSIDNHPMTVIATDSAQIKPQETDSVILHVAERFEVYIHANQAVGNYWIRVETLEVGKKHNSFAILKYEGADSFEPTTQPKDCREDDICRLVNCPFQSYPPEYYSSCTNLDALQSAETIYTPQGNQTFENHMLYFSFVGGLSAINGLHFRLPQAPPVNWGKDTYDGKCRGIGVNGVCTHQVNVELGSIAQFVLASDGIHPIHLHGYDFQVVKIGYPKDPYNKQFPDELLCDERFQRCYLRPDLDPRNLPDMNMNPVLKDTVTIPAYGYVVIRINATNPGWWIMHCHIEPHLIEGMALIVKVGNDSQMHDVPANISTCSSFLPPANDGVTLTQANGGVKVAYAVLGILPMVYVLGMATLGLRIWFASE